MLKKVFDSVSTHEEQKNLLKDIEIGKESTSVANEEEKNGICSKDICVDIRMIPSKLCFFLNDSLHVIYASYIIIFLSSIGLNVKEASVISGFCLVVAAISGPVWGYVADRIGRSDIIFVILVTGTSICLTPSPWIAASMPIKDTNSTNETLTSTLPFKSNLFWSMLVLQSVGTSFLNPIHAFTVSLVMIIIKTSNKEVEFGKQNLFGSIGITINSAIGGIIIKSFSSLTLSQYTPIFYLVLTICIVLLPTGLLLSYQAKPSRNKLQLKPSQNRIAIIWTFCNGQNIVFLFTVILAGISSVTMTSFLFQLMNDQMGGSKLAMGLANTVAAIGEIFVFFLSGRIMRAFKGPINCMMLSILSYFIRFLLLSFLTNAWLVLPIQILHGFSFAIFWVGATEYSYQVANEDIYTTVFSTVMSAYLNIGGLFGNFIGGFIYNDYGGTALFFGMSWLSGIWFIFMVFYFHVKIPRNLNRY